MGNRLRLLVSCFGLELRFPKGSWTNARRVASIRSGSVARNLLRWVGM
jgi:hypothetical protein